MKNQLWPVLCVLAVLSLTAAGCSDDGPDTGASTTTTEVVTTTQSSAETTLAAPTVTVDDDGGIPVADVVIDVEFVGGEVEVSDNRIKIELGQLVQLDVTSDVDDEVHVHGYDFTVNAVAGQTVSLGFEANVPGVFEVEFEKSGVLIAELEVS